jgi:hypothetical protein
MLLQGPVGLNIKTRKILKGVNLILRLLAWDNSQVERISTVPSSCKYQDILKWVTITPFPTPPFKTITSHFISCYTTSVPDTMSLNNSVLQSIPSTADSYSENLEGYNKNVPLNIILSQSTYT